MRSALTVLGVIALVALVLAPGTVLAAPSNPTYTKDIAPILNENCVVCHRPGEIGPMSLLSYSEVRPWAKSISKYVQEGTMPPWHADPGYGPWKNERSLSQEQIDTIVRWAAQGAPQGRKKDMPKRPKFDDSGWRLGEPDYVFEFKEVEIEGGGPDRFFNFEHNPNFDEDKWLRAVEIQPGSRKVVHHVILWQGGINDAEGWIGAWAAGAQPMQFPEKTGRLLRKGKSIIGDMHYHPADDTESDQTRVGLYFGDNDYIEKELINLWILNTSFEIPAGDPNYQATSTHTFAEDSHIWGLAPHLHYRGKDFSYTLTYPDGRTQDLLKVSKYDFNWQTNYEYVEPLAVPAGSRIDCVAHWDNSADNPANPDPTKNVRFGNESYDEMMIGFVDYTVDEGVRPAKTVNPIIAKTKELVESYPGEVFSVMIQQGGAGPEPSAVHLPREGEGGWYVRIGSIAGKAPIREIAWQGDAFEATAYIPGQDPQKLSGSVEGDSITINMILPTGGSVPIKGERAE